MGLYWIRPAATRDTDAITSVHNEAFGQLEEGQFVETLGREGLILVSLVAEIDDLIAGHIVFSRVILNTGARAALLAPLAVLPRQQGKGIGSALVRAGLDVCRQLEVAVVVVLGHPQYYPRFGFSAELGRKLTSPYTSHGDAWMAMELAPLAIPDSGGLIEVPSQPNQ